MQCPDSSQLRTRFKKSRCAVAATSNNSLGQYSNPKWPPSISSTCFWPPALSYTFRATAGFAPGISSVGASTQSDGTRKCGLHNPGWNGAGVSGVTRVATFSQPEPCRAPYSMNQRKAVIGVSNEGVPSWSAETTGSGPTLVPPDPVMSPSCRVRRRA